MSKNSSIDSTPLTVSPVRKGSKDPNSVAPIFPDADQRPDTTKQADITADPIGTGSKLSVDILKQTPTQHGRSVHDATSSSVDHAPGLLGVAHDRAPEKTNFIAPQKKGWRE
jgi:hypothetical protein